MVNHIINKYIIIGNVSVLEKLDREMSFNKNNPNTTLQVNCIQMCIIVYNKKYKKCKEITFYAT